MQKLQYIAHYPEHTRELARKLIDDKRLGDYILNKYPSTHNISNDTLLYNFALKMKNSSIKKSTHISKIVYDGKLCNLHSALGINTLAVRVQGAKLKSKNEIHIATTFKNAPEEFLRMIVAHELSHLKIKDHNRSFYTLCTHLEPNYHQLEFDFRLYLTHLTLFGELYLTNSDKTCKDKQ